MKGPLACNATTCAPEWEEGSEDIPAVCDRLGADCDIDVTTNVLDCSSTGNRGGAGGMGGSAGGCRRGERRNGDGRLRDGGHGRRYEWIVIRRRWRSAERCSSVRWTAEASRMTGARADVARPLAGVEALRSSRSPCSRILGLRRRKQLTMKR